MSNHHGANQRPHPVINAQHLTVGTVILYHLPPEDQPTHPERLWRGRICQTFFPQITGLDVVWVESLEAGFEGLTEYVWLSQIVGIEPGEKPLRTMEQR